MNTYSPHVMRTCAYSSQFQNLYREEPLVIIPTQGGVRELAFIPNETLAAGLTGDVVSLWNSLTFQPMRILEPQELDGESFLYSMNIAYGPNETGTLVGGSTRGNITIWDVMTGDILRTIRVGNPILSISCSPDGTIAAGSGNGNVTLWNLFSGALIKTLPTTTNRGIQGISSVRYNFDGTVLAAGSVDGNIYVWSAPFQDDIPRILNNAQGPLIGAGISSIIFDRDGILAAGNNSGGISLWNPRTSELLRRLDSRGSTVTSMTYNQYGHLVTASQTGVISVWDSTSGILLQTFRSDPQIRTVASNPYTGLLATGSWQGTINIYAPTSRPGGKRAR